MTDTTVTRRGLIAGVVAVVGALATRAAEAFTLRDRLRFRAASELLEPEGVTVRGATVRDHDVLVLDVVARPDLQYDHIVRERTRTGELDPCFRTSDFGGVEQFSLFEPDTGGVPSYTTRREGGVVTSAHFHPRVSGVDPCIRTTVTGDTQASVELFDLTEERDPGLIVPCLRVDAEMTEAGALGPVTFAHFHPRVSDIVPCLRTTVAGETRASLELIDLAEPLERTDDGSIVPCLRLDVAMTTAGELGLVDLAVEHDEQFKVRVRQADGSEIVYVLRDGRLFEEV